MPNGVNPGSGVTIAPNPVARDDAYAKVKTFLRDGWHRDGERAGSGGRAASRIDPATIVVERSRMDLGLTDKVVVVTGASKGIGYACAAAFAAEGARVVLVSRSAANLDAALAQLAGGAACAAGHRRRPRRRRARRSG